MEDRTIQAGFPFREEIIYESGGSSEFCEVDVSLFEQLDSPWIWFPSNSAPFPGGLFRALEAGELFRFIQIGVVF